jgi:catechol 2,3-dioxygenase-like lactoylglutathione lyase family enzyme
MLATPTPDYEGPRRHRASCERARRWSEVPWVIDGVLVYVPDVDAHYTRAKRAGATILSEPEDGFPARRYRAEDPEGHRWMFMARPAGGSDSGGGSMLGGAQVTAFLATADAAQARRFYEEVLGFRLLSDDQFALAFDSNGIQLRIQKVPKVEPPPFTALGWQVADIDATVAALSAAGIGFERYSFMPQDAMGIWTAPGGTRVAWFKDPDGNLLSLAEHGETQA